MCLARILDLLLLFFWLNSNSLFVSCICFLFCFWRFWRALFSFSAVGRLVFVSLGLFMVSVGLVIWFLCCCLVELEGSRCMSFSEKDCWDFKDCVLFFIIIYIKE